MRQLGRVATPTDGWDYRQRRERLPYVVGRPGLEPATNGFPNGRSRTVSIMPKYLRYNALAILIVRPEPARSDQFPVIRD
jgi:hypothetical protein